MVESSHRVADHDTRRDQLDYCQQTRVIACGGVLFKIRVESPRETEIVLLSASTHDLILAIHCSLPLSRRLTSPFNLPSPSTTLAFYLIT